MIALALGLASCGGGDDSAVSGDGGGSAPAPGPTPSPSPAPAPGPSPTPSPAPSPSPSPSPEPAPAPPPSASGAATECLNRKPWEQPTDLRYVLSSNGNQTTVTLKSTPGSMFEGQTATEFAGNIVTPGGPTLQNRFYERLDGNTVLRFGFRRLSSAGGGPETDQSFSPPLQDVRYTLNAGESKTSTTMSTVTTNGVSIGAIPYEVTYTYVGRERVTVPAGTFNTCHFQTVTPSQVPGAQSNTRSEWFAVGSGMIVQSQDEGVSADQLVEASIDGQPITGN